MEKNYIQNNGKAKGKIYIGLDHGYGNIKTAHRVFTAGVEAYDEEPIVSTNFVKIPGEILCDWREPFGIIRATKQIQRISTY